MVLKRILNIERLGASRFGTSIAAVGLQLAGFLIVAKIRSEIFVLEKIFDLWIPDRGQDLNTAVEISRHPIGTAEI